MSTTKPLGITNHASLATFAKRFAPVYDQAAEAPKPPASSDFFSEMNLDKNISLDNGDYATIDVQPDFRYIYMYIAFYVSALYPEFEIKGHPYASTHSIIAYCLLLVHAHLLVCDLSSRRQASYHASVFRNDSNLKDYLNVLLNAKIPAFLMPLIEQLAPTYDPRRTKIEYVPTLAAFSFKHDFGRTLVPQIFLAAHQQVASVRANTEPEDLLARFYGLELAAFNNTTFFMGHIFGTHYSDGTNVNIHNNWLNQSFESIYNPVVGRFLTARPTFAKINITPNGTMPRNTAARNPVWNQYVYALSAHDENVSTMQDFTNSLSRFVNSEDANTIMLGQLAQKISGITILAHSIEPVTQPTWTHLKMTKSDKKTAAPTSIANHQTFATHNKFLTTPKAPNSNLKYPTDDSTIEKGLYLVSKVKYDSDADPLEYVLFSENVHVAPYVFYFQPYDVSPSSIGFTIALGLKIELAEIDGFMVPTPEHRESLDFNNSQLFQSAVTLDKITPVQYQDRNLHLRTRVLTESNAQKFAAAFRDMSRNVLPIFSPDHYLNGGHGFQPFTKEENATDMFLNATFAAGQVPGSISIPDAFVYGWSSYRVVHVHKSSKESDISMILSFRPVFGTNVTLSSSKNPSVIIPK